MALDYIVAIATDRSMLKIAALVKSICLLYDISDRTIATSLINGVSLRRGLYIRVSAARSPAWEDSKEERFVFKPTVSIFLRLNKNEILDAQVTDMLFIATKLLAATSDDMIVYFLESGDVWAIRRGGRLEINSAPFMWTPERTKMLDQSYTRMSYAP